MVVWHLADVSLNPSVNALPGWRDAAGPDERARRLGAHRRAGRAAHRRRRLGAGRARPELPAVDGRAAGRAGLGAGGAPHRCRAADHQLLLPHRHEPALIVRPGLRRSPCWPPAAPVSTRSTRSARSAASGAPSRPRASSRSSSGISQWVASGAEWLLGQIGDVLSVTTTVDVGATWFRTHYGQMTALAGVVILPMLLVSTLQAVVRQNPGQLVRTFLVQLPLALLLAVVAIQIVILSLSATDAMSDAVAGGTGADVTLPAHRRDHGPGRRRGRPDHRQLRAAAHRAADRRGGVRAVARAAHPGRRRLRGGALPAAGAGHPGLAGGVALVPAPGRDAGGPDPLQVRHRGHAEPGGRRRLLGHRRHGRHGSGFSSVLAGRRAPPHGHLRPLRHPAHDPGRRGGRRGASRRAARSGGPPP